MRRMVPATRGEEAAVLKVWGRINSINVQKVLWVLGELQLPCERIDAGMAFGVVNEAPYKKINPNARVPTIDEDGFVLWESNVIVRYLAAKYGAGGLCPTDLRTRADCERWMDWASIHLNPAMGPAFLGLVRTPAEQRNMAQIAASAAATAEQFQILEQSLGDRHYVVGQGFTMADIVIGVNAYRWYALDVQRPHLPRLEAYHARLQQRPAFRKHVMLPLS
jgi:glutathione S-transferase